MSQRATDRKRVTLSPQQLRDIDCLISEHVCGHPVVERIWPYDSDFECGGFHAAYDVPVYPLVVKPKDRSERGPVYVPVGGRWPPEKKPPLYGRGRPYYSALVAIVPYYSTDITEAWDLLLEQTPGQSVAVMSDREHFWTVLINGSLWLGLADGVDALPLAICRALLNRAGIMLHPLEIPELDDEEVP